MGAVEVMDPASLQVLISRLSGIAAEMGEALVRSAFSPNINERADCSAAVFGASGEMLAQAEHIPVHLGSMPASVAAAISGVGAQPGAQIILNDPFAGGTHLNDVTLVAPCYVEGALVGWVANRAHHADLGGMAPGSIPPAATEVFQEGLRIPPVAFGPEVAAMVYANSRTPEERRADLDGQAGANSLGVERLASLVRAIGSARAAAEAFEEVVAHGERRMRGALAALSPGVFEAEDVLDSTGVADGQREPATIRLRLTVRTGSSGGEASFDFRATDAQRPGNLNAVEAVTASAVAWAVRYATDPSVPAGSGSLRPVRILTAPGSIVSARFPAAVGAGNVEVSQRIADVCLLALSRAGAATGAAGQGTMNNLILGGRSGWVYYETIGGGEGARAGRRGMSGVHTAMTNTRDTPAEALERAYPLRVLRYRLRYGSGGRARWPGGDGTERVIQVLEPATLSLITERRTSRPWGLAGGEAGAAGENWLWPAGDESKRVPLADKVTLELAAGDAVQVLTPGGGGFGSASDRAAGDRCDAALDP
jgi:N-methylhydantoinase B/oxoprolinase/acetone carboxylase alpha subunit